MSIPVFFLERVTNLYEYSLRRFTYSKEVVCPQQSWGHEASSGPLWKGPASDCQHTSTSELGEIQAVTGDHWPHDDARWPKTCTKCGYTFVDTDQWQFRSEPVYRKHGTEELLTLWSAPVGAMWFADWMNYRRQLSPDGHILCVRLPGNHDWMPESRARNCDSPCVHCGKPYNVHLNSKGEPSGRCQPNWEYGDGNPHYEDSRPHLCWVRHGTPPGDIVHVDKSGVTCGAGGGSIAIPNWHGFLHNGQLVG